MKTTPIKKIKESITPKQYKLLMQNTRGKTDIRESSRNNLLKIYTILFYTGLRVNEIQEMTMLNIAELINNAETKINLPKTKSERKLFASKAFINALLDIIDINAEDNANQVIQKGSDKTKQQRMAVTGLIQMVNKDIKSVLGNGFSSHSFRQGIITEMGRTLNPALIKSFIGHKSIKTTLAYIRPTDEDIVECMIR